MIRDNTPDLQSGTEKPEELNEKEKASFPRVKVGNMETQRRETIKK